MKLTLIRDDCGPGRTLGTLRIDGVYFCQTLEDEDRRLEADPAAKIPGETAIPRGTYRVIIDHSQRFGRDMPHILDVPGYEGVRIHSGNTAADTDGCILVGNVRSGDRILNSRGAFLDLAVRLGLEQMAGREITLEVK